ncbi:cellulase family glycosylhydrolase [Flavobacterium sp.]|uniref:cellulase family glycosylhydrolase n=1 Tax=Flavobacterium sp. TaxID=239 RepID=UPI0026193B20|nr:cellulase family glycosylhydrolase [Flavobacterium sp.]
MSLINNKISIRVILIVTFIAVNLLVIMGINSVLTYMNSGASRTSMLHLDKETVNTYLPNVKWESLENPGRIMEPNTLKTIEKHYLFSWVVKNKSLEDNRNEGIEDYYTQNARTNLYRTIGENSKKNLTIESTTLEHHPSLEFYSADGQLVVFTDRNVVEFQKIFQSEKLIATIQDTASYKVMMLLEDGFWRVRHIQKMKPSDFPIDTVVTAPVFKVSGKKIYKNDREFVMKGINYYPKNSAWDTFGTAFNKDTIGRDLDIIKSAKLNTIRIFVQYEDFGKADVKQEKLDKLKNLLDMAASRELAVIVTLFDFYSDYSIADWTLTHRHAEKIVSTFKDHKAIIAWDLKNEPNLDFEKRNQSNVLEWLEHLIPVIRQSDPNHLITIGWSNSAAAVQLKDKVDFVSYHFYNAIDDFEKEHGSLEKAVNKPVVIQEFGLPSDNGIWHWSGHSEKDQAVYHEKMQAQFKKNHLAFLSWTLYDFPSIPNQVAGKWPWVKSKQKSFGFLNSKGKKKPSFSHITYE